MRLNNKKKSLYCNLPKNAKTDYVLIFTVLFLLVFGIIMVYSASSYSAEYNYGNKFYYMYKQIFGVILGAVVCFAVSMIDYHYLT